MGPSWASWVVLGLSWAVLGLSWSVLSRLGTCLKAVLGLSGTSWVHLGLSWAILNLSWGCFGVHFGRLGPSRNCLGLSWTGLGCLGAVLGHFGDLLGYLTTQTLNLTTVQRFSRFFEARWAVLGTSWCHGGCFGPSWDLVGPSWACLDTVLGSSWTILGRLGAVFGHLGLAWVVLVPFWGCFGGVLDSRGAASRRVEGGGWPKHPVSLSVYILINIERDIER